MNQPNGEPKSSVAYGQACMYCVKAKCKCISRENGSGCERCHRLGKDCRPSASIRKTNARKSNTLSRTSKLEDKLDNLVSLLQAQQAAGATLAEAPGAFAPIGQQTTEPQSRHALPLAGLPSIQGRCDIFQPTPSSSDASPGSSSLTPGHGPSEALNIFRTRYLINFPLVHIPENQSIEEFQKERPLTLQAICTICEFSGERQSARATKIRDQIALKVIARSERSADLLLATLIIAVWHIYFTNGRPDFGMFTGICGAMIRDMRLVRHNPLTCGGTKIPPLYEPPDSKETITDDDRRALLAHSIVSSILFVYVYHKHHHSSSFPYLDAAARKLMLNHNIFGDRVLVAIFRIYKIATEATIVLRQVSDSMTQVSHALLHVQPLRTMFDQIQGELGHEELENIIVKSTLHNTAVLIHEVALLAISSSPISVTEPSITMQCVNCLTTCLHSCKAALESLTDMKVESINATMIFAWIHSMQVLFKLVLLEYPGWDRNLARTIADPLYYFQRTINMMKAAGQELEKRSGSADNIFARAPETMKVKIGAWTEHLESHDAATAAAAASASAPTATTIQGSGLVSESFDGGNLAMGFDFMDTSWLGFPDDMFFPNIFD